MSRVLFWKKLAERTHRSLECLQLLKVDGGLPLDTWELFWSFPILINHQIWLFNPTLVNCIVMFKTLEHQEDCKELARIKRSVEPKEGLGRWADHMFAHVWIGLMTLIRSQEGKVSNHGPMDPYVYVRWLPTVDHGHFDPVNQIPALWVNCRTFQEILCRRINGWRWELIIPWKLSWTTNWLWQRRGWERWMTLDDHSYDPTGRGKETS